MAKVLFLSEATLKAESILQDNVDMKVVSPTIYDVQQYYILPILGTSLYNDVVSQVQSGTVSAAYQTLLDTYIQPTMIWYCRYELPMNMNYKYFNKAVGVQNADNMTPASIEEIAYITDRAKNKAEWYAERLTKSEQSLIQAQTTVRINALSPQQFKMSMVKPITISGIKQLPSQEEFTSSVIKTSSRIGTQVYAVDQDGNKTGVIVICYLFK